MCIAQQMNNVQMLFTLRHYAVIGRNREEHQVDTMGASQHVADKPFMPWHIDHACASAIRQTEPSEAEVNRDAAILLFLKAVSVLTGERLDQRGLAMVDMAGCADNRVDDSCGHRLLFASDYRTAGRGARSPTLVDRC